MDVTNIEPPIPQIEISDMARMGEKLYISNTSNDIIICGLNEASVTKPFIQEDIIQFKEKRVIKGLYFVESLNLLFIHCWLDSETPGPILTIDSSKSIKVFANSARCFAISASAQNPALVFSDNNFFYYYSIKDKKLQEPISEDLCAEIQYLALNETGVATYANSSYRIWFTQTHTTTNVAVATVFKPLIVPLDDVSFVFCLNGLIIVSGPEGSKTSAPITIKKDQAGSNTPNIGCAFDKTLYLFYNSCIFKGRLQFGHKNNLTFQPFSRVNCFTKFGESLVLVADSGMFLFGGASDGILFANLIISKGIEIASLKISSYPLDKRNAAMPDTFRFLWEKNMQKEALQLITEYLWEDDIREILVLFPFFVFPQSFRNRQILDGLSRYDGDSKEIFEQLGSMLLYTESEYKYSRDPKYTTQLPVLDTCLFEYYAVFHQTRALDEFMSKDNSIVAPAVGKFFNIHLTKRSLHPALAVYFAHNDKMDESFNVWKALNDADKSKRWAFEASFILRRVTDIEVVKSNLNWIRSRSKEAAVNTFMHPDVNFEFAMNWIESKANQYLIMFLDYAVDLPNCPETVPQQTLDLFLDTLKVIQTPNVSPSKLTFSKIARDTKKKKLSGEEMSEIDKYVTDRIISIVRAHSSVDIKAACETVSKCKRTKLLFDLYSVGELYYEAMDGFMSLWDLDLKKIQDFCRMTPHPESAFKTAIERLVQEGYSLGSRLRTFLLDNIEWISYKDILGWMSDEDDLSDVAPILTAADSIYVMKRTLHRAEAGILSSMKVDADYRLSRAEVRSVEVQYETACEACKRPVGSGFISVAPDGKIYHLACKPIDVK